MVHRNKNANASTYARIVSISYKECKVKLQGYFSLMRLAKFQNSDSKLCDQECGNMDTLTLQGGLRASHNRPQREKSFHPIMPLLGSEKWHFLKHQKCGNNLNIHNRGLNT